MRFTAHADDRTHRMILTARPIPADWACLVLGLVIRTCRDQIEGEVTVVSSSLSCAMEVAPWIVGSLDRWIVGVMAWSGRVRDRESGARVFTPRPVRALLVVGDEVLF